MIVGENCKSDDMDVNVLKGKALTNMRASGSDENVILSPAVYKTLEEMMVYINDDECIEVTPKTLRMRKKYLEPNERKRKSQSAASSQKFIDEE